MDNDKLQIVIETLIKSNFDEKSFNALQEKYMPQLKKSVSQFSNFSKKEMATLNQQIKRMGEDPKYLNKMQVAWKKFFETGKSETEKMGKTMEKYLSQMTKQIQTINKELAKLGKMPQNMPKANYNPVSRIGTFLEGINLGKDSYANLRNIISRTGKIKNYVGADYVDEVAKQIAQIPIRPARTRLPASLVKSRSRRDRANPSPENKLKRLKREGNIEGYLEAYREYIQDKVNEFGPEYQNAEKLAQSLTFSSKFYDKYYGQPFSKRTKFSQKEMNQIESNLPIMEDIYQRVKNIQSGRRLLEGNDVEKKAGEKLLREEQQFLNEYERLKGKKARAEEKGKSISAKDQFLYNIYNQAFENPEEFQKDIKKQRGRLIVYNYQTHYYKPLKKSFLRLMDDEMQSQLQNFKDPGKTYYRSQEDYESAKKAAVEVAVSQKRAELLADAGLKRGDYKTDLEQARLKDLDILSRKDQQLYDSIENDRGWYREEVANRLNLSNTRLEKIVEDLIYREQKKYSEGKNPVLRGIKQNLITLDKNTKKRQLFMRLLSNTDRGRSLLGARQSFIDFREEGIPEMINNYGDILEARFRSGKNENRAVFNSRLRYRELFENVENLKYEKQRLEANSSKKDLPELVAGNIQKRQEEVDKEIEKKQQEMSKIEKYATKWEEDIGTDKLINPKVVEEASKKINEKAEEFYEELGKPLEQITKKNKRNRSSSRTDPIKKIEMDNNQLTAVLALKQMEIREKALNIREGSLSSPYNLLKIGNIEKRINKSRYSGRKFNDGRTAASEEYFRGLSDEELNKRATQISEASSGIRSSSYNYYSSTVLDKLKETYKKMASKKLTGKERESLRIQGAEAEAELANIESMAKFDEKSAQTEEKFIRKEIERRAQEREEIAKLERKEQRERSGKTEASIASEMTLANKYFDAKNYQEALTRYQSVQNMSEDLKKTYRSDFAGKWGETPSTFKTPEEEKKWAAERSLAEQQLNSAINRLNANIEKSELGLEKATKALEMERSGVSQLQKDREMTRYGVRQSLASANLERDYARLEYNETGNAENLIEKQKNLMSLLTEQDQELAQKTKEEKEELDNLIAEMGKLKTGLSEENKLQLQILEQKRKVLESTLAGDLESRKELVGRRRRLQEEINSVRQEEKRREKTNFATEEFNLKRQDRLNMNSFQRFFSRAFVNLAKVRGYMRWNPNINDLTDFKTLRVEERVEKDAATGQNTTQLVKKFGYEFGGQLGRALLGFTLDASRLLFEIRKSWIQANKDLASSVQQSLARIGKNSETSELGVGASLADRMLAAGYTVDEIQNAAKAGGFGEMQLALSKGGLGVGAQAKTFAALKNLAVSGGGEYADIFNSIPQSQLGTGDSIYRNLENLYSTTESKDVKDRIMRLMQGLGTLNGTDLINMQKMWNAHNGKIGWSTKGNMWREGGKENGELLYYGDMLAREGLGSGDQKTVDAIWNLDTNGNSLVESASGRAAKRGEISGKATMTAMSEEYERYLDLLVKMEEKYAELDNKLSNGQVDRVEGQLKREFDLSESTLNRAAAGIGGTVSQVLRDESVWKTAGGVIGGAVGGPVGAAVGLAIGSALAGGWQWYTDKTR